MYGPLKRFHAQEVDRYTRAGLKSIREKGLISGWRAAVLIPFLQQRVLANEPPLRLRTQPFELEEKG